MRATQSESAIADNEALQPVLEGLEIKILAIEQTDRWSIYHRLQELGIPCNCAIAQPLEARIDSPTAALQLWSIAHRYRASRNELLDFLEDCWQTRICA
ncbi:MULTISPECIES: Asr1405/Asl0597 family protein [Spirulina sp. CCY15215]|uniref:Asr1405/Asl0597 family protein n=1 Tax=Spirulina sp. CCY15215 TaxID=2767591 RepID=UPI0019518EB9|nr:Asr1405/Asl0597 family protein [Spirulina major]